MRELFFVQADVFTARPFGGNQLAVFPEAEGLDSTTRVTLAREMNYSESTFVERQGADGCARRVRICVPVKEIPFAGHPTVGTAAVLYLRGEIPARCSLELGIGPVDVEVEAAGPRSARAWMRQPRARFGPALNLAAQAARALGLQAQDIDQSIPMRVGGNGMDHLMVALLSRDALRRIRIDAGAFDALVTSAGSPEIYAFTLASPDPGTHVSARMFAPTIQIPEDPATGSAAGPLAAHLADCGVKEAAPGRTLVVTQGVEMGRPSVLECNVIGLAHANEGVRVGGGVEIVGEGKIFLPA